MKKLLPVIVLALLVIIGLAAGVFGGLYIQAQKEAALKKPVEEKPASRNLQYDLPEILVGLTKDEARGHILRISLTLVCSQDDDLSHVKMFQPRIFDVIQLYIRDFSTSDLRGKAAIEKLKKDLPRIIDDAIAPGHIETVLIKTMGITDS